jgi:hypothetical protein
MRKKKLKKLTSPVGTAIYPHLSKPDTKFNEDGEYRVNLRLSMDDAKPLVRQSRLALRCFPTTRGHLVQVCLFV